MIRNIYNGNIFRYQTAHYETVRSHLAALSTTILAHEIQHLVRH